MAEEEQKQKEMRPFRYQQIIQTGAPGPNLYIAEEISNQRFRIAGVTGFRLAMLISAALCTAKTARECPLLELWG